ncbi:hypothetical protein UY3_13410 [Chelonia mydas]|uniref:Uncharacterized protein n=1 Tax=Chelonia mydas TaxID=8469 RepID=M7BMQ8_CHEMY|nr:hypothetical protein UY3_13410 [Chelonia mydas]
MEMELHETFVSSYLRSAMDHFSKLSSAQLPIALRGRYNSQVSMPHEILSASHIDFIQDLQIRWVHTPLRASAALSTIALGLLVRVSTCTGVYTAESGPTGGSIQKCWTPSTLMDFSGICGCSAPLKIVP